MATVLITAGFVVWYTMCGYAISYWLGDDNVQFDDPRMTRTITALVILFWLPILTASSVALLLRGRD